MPPTTTASRHTPDARIARREKATTTEWLADLETSFEAAVIAIHQGLLPAQLLPQHDAGRLGLLLTRREWGAVVDAASRHLGQLESRSR